MFSRHEDHVFQDICLRSSVFKYKHVEYQKEVYDTFTDKYPAEFYDGLMTITPPINEDKLWECFNDGMNGTHVIYYSR